MNIKITLDFIEAINNADVDKICSLMSVDHIFIDSQDNLTTGKDCMKKAWVEYFRMFPDYKIEIDDILEKDSMVCLLGHASGTYRNLQNKTNGNHWRIPASWKAIINNNKVTQWQVYADNLIVADIIKRNN
jgi:ketosteroid isomerase-like protein